MASQNQIFSLLLLLSFLWYMCHRHEGIGGESEGFVVNNVMRVPPMVADNVYRYNNDLAYEETREIVPTLSLAENVQTQRIAPIINPTQGQVVPGLYSGVTIPNSRQTTRVPDDLSDSTCYNIPTPQYDNAQGGFQNTNSMTPTKKNTVWGSNFIYQ